MTERSGSGQAPPATGGEARPARPSVARPPDRRHQRRWVPVAAGWLALLIGLADVTEGAVPGLYAHYRLHRIGDLAPGTLTNLTRTADVIIGLLLLMLSHGLRRRKRRACQAVTLLLGASVVIHLAHYPLVATAFVFLRPAEPAGRLSGQDAARIRDLLDRHGKQDSLGYFTLRDDKSIIWSPTGKSCIGYRVLSGVMLAAGDPIGDPEAWPGAIHAFLDEAARHAWVPAVVGCGELGAEVWCREGDLTALELGDEAIVDVASFSLEGRAMRNVRQMVSRVCRQGYAASFHRTGDLPHEVIEDLIRRADSWRGSPTERGFSMALGRVGGPRDGQCVIATASEDGVLRGLLHFVPWGSDGLSLDLMRRDRAAQPGLNDFL